MEDLSKMKVTELKQALKDRGLPSSGTKPDLLKRLEEALAQSTNADSVDDSLQEIEDDILNEETDIPSTKSSKPEVGSSHIPSKIDAPTQGAGDGDASKLKSADLTKETDVISKPVSNLSEEERKKIRAEKFGIVSPEDQKAKRAERFGITSPEDQKAKRAERFGIVSTEDKKAQRAARFGLPDTGSTTGSAKISMTGTEVDIDKLKKRAERFGAVISTSLTKTDLDEKKRKRAARFGEVTANSNALSTSNSITVTDSDLIAKKKARAERFGITA